MSKLMDKKQALAAMALGMRIRHINWDNPYHSGCAYCYLKEGNIWSKDKNHSSGNNFESEWLTVENFKTNGALETGWYIYGQDT